MQLLSYQNIYWNNNQSKVMLKYIEAYEKQFFLAPEKIKQKETLGDVAVFAISSTLFLILANLFLLALNVASNHWIDQLQVFII